MCDPVDKEMPFTGHDADELLSVLNKMANCPLPVEVFDAFLSEYKVDGDLWQSLGFALSEWDC